MSTLAHAYCDANLARCIDGAEPATHPNVVLATTVLASSLAFVDGSVVNVALPAIGRAFPADPDSLQWCINAYLLPLSAMLLFGGAAGDRFGRRVLLLVGVSLFALASLACALSTGLMGLLAARFVQGIAAALLLPNSLAILGQTFTGPARGRAVGIWAAASGATGAIGPVLGGWLIDISSWRAVFLINLPIAAAGIALTLVYLPTEHLRRKQPLDVSGAALITLALGALTWTLTVASGPRGWGVAATAMGVMSILLLIAFVVVEKRRADQALMPLALFASRQPVGLNVVTLLLYAALNTLVVLVPYVLIEAQSYSATRAGAALLPLPIIMTLFSPVLGAFAARVGARTPVAIGSVIVGIGMLLALRIHISTSYWTGLLPCVVVVSVGLSFAVAPLTTAVLSQAAPSLTGLASGFNSAVARTGGLLATSLLGLVFASHGASLIRLFHAVMGVGGLVCWGAALSALALLRPTKPARQLPLWASSEITK
jgi:EmrB/QacA subfamily drug resistance transporter